MEDKVLNAMKEAGKPVRPGDIAKALGVDSKEVSKACAELKKAGINISVNVFVVKAVALALREMPLVNSVCVGDSVIYKSKVNVGVAVSIPNGLVVPVVRNADKKSMDEIAAEVAELAAKARDGKLSSAEMQGGTFSISNMGMMNVESFNALINPGDSGILAVSSAIPTPVVVGEEKKIEVRDIMKVTLSVDHRVVDGSDGAAFVNLIKKNLESKELWDSLV